MMGPFIPAAPKRTHGSVLRRSAATCDTARTRADGGGPRFAHSRAGRCAPRAAPRSTRGRARAPQPAIRSGHSSPAPRHAHTCAPASPAHHARRMPHPPRRTAHPARGRKEHLALINCRFAAISAFHMTREGASTARGSRFLFLFVARPPLARRGGETARDSEPTGEPGSAGGGARAARRAIRVFM